MERPSEPTMSGPMMPLVAPPSAPVALPRFVTPAEALAPAPAPAPFVPHAAPIVPMDLSGSAPVYPDLRPRSSRAIVFAFLGALVIGAGVGAYALMSKSSDAPAASLGSATEMQTTSTPIVAPQPPPPVETKPEPVKAPVVEKKPEPTKPVRVEETKPAPVEETKPEPPKPVVVDKPKPVPQPVQPVVKKPQPVQVQAPVVKKPQPVKPKEQQSWDPNSPFLPGQ